MKNTQFRVSCELLSVGDSGYKDVCLRLQFTCGAQDTKKGFHTKGNVHLPQMLVRVTAGPWSSAGPKQELVLGPVGAEYFYSRL